MSYDYYIVNRQLTKTEIKEKTDLEIRTQEKNGDWIVDKFKFFQKPKPTQPPDNMYLMFNMDDALINVIR